MIWVLILFVWPQYERQKKAVKHDGCFQQASILYTCWMCMLPFEHTDAALKGGIFILSPEVLPANKNSSDQPGVVESLRSASHLKK